MTLADIIAALVLPAGCFWFGWKLGRQRGQDEQRIADIIDQWRGGWRKLPKRDERTGKFTT